MYTGVYSLVKTNVYHLVYTGVYNWSTLMAAYWLTATSQNLNLLGSSVQQHPASTKFPDQPAGLPWAPFIAMQISETSSGRAPTETDVMLNEVPSQAGFAA